MTIDVGFSKGIRKNAIIAADELEAGAADVVQVGTTGFYIIRDKNDKRFIVTLEIFHNGKSYYMAFAD